MVKRTGVARPGRRATKVAAERPERRRDGRPPADQADAVPAVGATLRRMRAQRALSLERLARVSGVSRAMLCQIELGQSAPTINVLWKIAHALSVPFSALIADEVPTRPKVLTAASAKVLRSADGRFSSRALFPFDDERRTVEFYELRLAASAVERAEPHPPGTVENLIVTSGRLEMRVGEDRYRLAAGDAIQFAADRAHEYRNDGDAESVMYLVMTYADRPSGGRE